MLIDAAANLLIRHSLDSRTGADELRELVISRRRSAYVALDGLKQDQEAVLILEIRHQHEAGY